MLGIDIAELVAKVGKTIDAEALGNMRFEWIDLVISSMDDQGAEYGTHVERIYFDVEWWNAQKVQLDRVYLNGFLPEFACPRRPSKPVRGYVLSSGREMIVDGKKEWAKEWSVNDANELIQAE